MHTHTITAQAAIAAEQEMSPLWVYDTLMEEIEPDLTSANINRLDELYAGESEDEHNLRMTRYMDAFTLLDECVQDLNDEFDAASQRIIKAMRAVNASDNDEEEQKQVQEIEGEIEQSDFRA